MKSVLQQEERLGFLLSAAACQYLLPVRNKSQFLEKYSEIPHSTLRDVIIAHVISADAHIYIQTRKRQSNLRTNRSAQPAGKNLSHKKNLRRKI